MILIQPKPEKSQGKHILVSFNSKMEKDQDGNIYTKFQINKNTSDEILKILKLKLKEENGSDIIFSEIKRNNKDEIIKIKVNIKDNKGSSASATWKNNENPMPTIEFGKTSDGVFARTKQ